MQAWVWLAAYVLGFGVLQVILYRRFNGQTATTGASERGASRPAGGSIATREPAQTVQCSQCGTVNEADRMIRYCGSCAESLR